MKSNKPVTLIRGTNQFTADSLDYDNLSGVANLQGRVRGQLNAVAAPVPAASRAESRRMNARPWSSSPALRAASGRRWPRASTQAGYDLALVARRTAEIESWAGAERHARRTAIGSTAPTWPTPTASSPPAQDCIAQQGLPDVVIANAGISVGIDTAERGDLDVLAQTFATNNIGLAATFHPFVAAMAARGSGRLVGIGSVAAIRGLPGHGAYCASKAGVVAYCESLRGELRASGVKVVTLCPGYVDTPLTQGNRYGMPFLLQADEFADAGVPRHRSRASATASFRGRWAWSPS